MHNNVSNYTLVRHQQRNNLFSGMNISEKNFDFVFIKISDIKKNN